MLIDGNTFEGLELLFLFYFPPLIFIFCYLTLSIILSVRLFHPVLLTALRSNHLRVFGQLLLHYVN